MALKKRSKPDLSILDEGLPLNNVQLYEQNNHNLRKCLEQYRKDNESLHRNNVILERKNEMLEHLVNSISSLWDALNADIDLYLSQRIERKELREINGKGKPSEDEGGNKGMFWEKMLTTKFPYVSASEPEDDVNLDDFVYMFDNDQFLFPDDFYDEEEWDRVKEDYIESNIGVFEYKKEALLRSVARSRPDFKFDESGLVKILKYNCLHYAKLFFSIYDKYKKLKSTHNSLKIEVSRLNKQNAHLRFEIKASCDDEAKKDVESSSSSTESDAEPVKVVENVEEVTEEMIVGSSLYSRLFNYAQNMDKQIAKLEAENSELRTQISHITEDPADQYVGIKANFDKLSEELKEKMENFENRYHGRLGEAASLKEKYAFVQQELDRYKDEHLKLVDELNQREMKISKLLQHNASVCKSIASDTMIPVESGKCVTCLSQKSSEFVKSEDFKDSNHLVTNDSMAIDATNPSDLGNHQGPSPSVATDQCHDGSNANIVNDSANVCSNAPNVSDPNMAPNPVMTPGHSGTHDSTSNSTANVPPPTNTTAANATTTNSSYTSQPSKDVEFYKEQLLNISEELEEVSIAFETKQKICDDLMRQMNELESTRDKLKKTENAYNNLKERFDKLVAVTNNKVSTHATQSESLEKLVESYKEAWVQAYRRASYMQHQRDVAVSAVCELEAQYRKSCRSQKALQDYISVMKTGAARSASVESSLGDVENLISQENAILRRRMLCTVCSENFRDHVITKCGHVFCGVCLNNSIKTRNRKCPQCKIIFDKNDTQKIFLD